MKIKEIPKAIGDVDIDPAVWVTKVILEIVINCIALAIVFGAFYAMKQ
jgi:hypothetical protein